MKFFLFALLFSALNVHALDVEYFDFPSSKTFATLDDALLENSFVDNDYPWIFTTAYDYVKIPLSIQNENERTDEIVNSLHSFHFGGGFRLSKSFFLGARTFVSRVDADEKGTYLGESTVEAKWRFYQSAHSAIALAPAVFLPTASQEFLGNKRKAGSYLGLNFERRFTWLQASLMLGYSLKPGATFDMGNDYSKIDYKQSVYTALGLYIPISEDFALNIEGYRHNQFKGNQHPNEAYLGLRHQTTKSLQMFAGGSVGGIVDESANDFRFSLGLKYTPFEEEVSKPEPAPVMAQKPIPNPVPAPKPTIRERGLVQESELYGALVASETIYFANGSHNIDAFYQEVLKKFHVSSKNNGGYTLVLEGFASKAGNPAANLKLSQQRVFRTREYLQQLGSQKGIIREVAYGDTANDGSVSEALNRKVMLRLYKK